MFSERRCTGELLIVRTINYSSTVALSGLFLKRRSNEDMLRSVDCQPFISGIFSGWGCEEAKILYLLAADKNIVQGRFALHPDRRGAWYQLMGLRRLQRRADCISAPCGREKGCQMGGAHCGGKAPTGSKVPNAAALACVIFPSGACNYFLSG